MKAYKSFSRATITNKSTEACIRYYCGKGYSVYEEVGLKSGGNLRADVVAFNMKGEIIIVEVKSCWQDFATDSKWQKYLPFCNKFYFCIPKWLYESDKGQFIKDLCKEHKAGLFILDTSDYNAEVVRLDEGTKTLPVWLTNVVPARRSNVEGKLRRWLITKLAWRGGLCAANLNPHKGITQLSEKYKFDAPIDEQSFLYKLDTIEQKEYLKRFPNSSFKQKLREPSVQRAIQQLRTKQTNVNEEKLDATLDKPKRRPRRSKRRKAGT